MNPIDCELKEPITYSTLSQYISFYPVIILFQNMVDVLQMGILLLIPLMANKRCLNCTSPRAGTASGDRGTGFATRIGNIGNKKGRIEERQSRSLTTEEARRIPHDYGKGVGGAANKSEAWCLGGAQDKVRH